MTGPGSPTAGRRPHQGLLAAAAPVHLLSATIAAAHRGRVPVVTGGDS